jgi:DNA repair exonuclease SbcCD ATPase subunit
MSINPAKTTAPMISRRLILSFSPLAGFGLLSGVTPGQSETREGAAKKASPKLPREFQDMMEKADAFSERMRNATSAEERRQIMHEQMVWQRQQSLESLKGELRASDAEWPVVKRRLQAVYDLVHPVRPIGGREEQPKNELEQRTRELRELLREDAPAADQIKAKLAALRATKERANQELAQARQNLRQIMNLRQEAVLVLNGLLD